MTPEEKKQKKLEKRTKKALRSYRCRPLKNFLWWFTGIICGIVFFVGGLVAGVMLIPINTFTGGNNEGVVSDELADSTILDIVLNLNSYGVSDLPILVDTLKQVTDGELGNYVDVDYDKLNEVKFGDNFAENFKACIKVVASIEDTIGVEALGDFGKLSIFTEWEEVEENIDVNAENFNAKLYYYNENQTAGVSLLSVEEGARFVRAFDDVGNKLAPNGAKIYYGALAKIPMLDAFDLIDERVGGILITELLTKLGGASLTGDSLIGNVLEGKRISEVGEITADDILISSVIGADSNSDIAKVLVEAMDGKPYVEITLGDLSNFNGEGFSFDNIKLSTVVNEDEIGDLIEILNDIFHADRPDGKQFEELTIGDLASLNFENVHVATVLPSGKDNSVLVEILEDEFKKDYEDIVLTDLESFDIGLLHLYKVIPESEIDSHLKQIICDMTGQADYNNIYVTDLHGKDGTSILDNIKLNSVIDDANGNVILEKLIAGETTVGELGSAIDNLALCDVYGDNVFKRASGGSVPSGVIRFNKSGNVYTMASNGEYYLSSDAGMWLFICYDAGTINADGRAQSYTENKTTLKDLQSSSSVIADSFSNATIRQLVDAGIVKSANEKIMTWTLEKVLNATNVIG